MTSLNDQLFAQRMQAEQQARLQAYKSGWQYYGGEQALPLRVKQGQPDDNVIINLYAYIVDKSVSFLFGKELEFQLAQNATEEAALYLDQCWTVNRKMSFMSNVALNGGVCGHMFVKMLPRDGLPPRLINLDPAIVSVIWNPDDLQDVLSYKIEFEAMDKDGQQVFKKQMIEAVKSGEQTTSWIIKNYIKTGSMRDYQPDPAHPDSTWDFPFAPICDWQNLPAPNEYYGKPDITSLRMQNGINFVASNVQRIIRYHGHPKTIGKGFQAKELDVGPDDMFILPSVDSDVKNLEMQSDLSATRNFFNDLRSLFLRTQHVPDLDPAMINVGALSGFAMRVLHGDLIELTEMKRRSYGDGLTDLNNRLLWLGAHKTEVTKIVWQDALPENRKETAEELDIEMNKLGTVSKETAQEQLGRDPEIEKERMQEEKAGQLNLGSVLLQAFEKGQTVPTG